jgi:hypothetical protein
MADPVPLNTVLVDHPEYLTAIGLITVEMSNLEIALGEMLGALLHIDRTISRTIYLTPQSAFGRFNVLENAVAVALTKGMDPRNKVERIIGKAKSYMGKRHKLVHDGWGRDKDTKEIYQLPFPVTGAPNIPRPINELKDLVLNIQALTGETRQLTEEMYGDWPPYTNPVSPKQAPPGQPGTHSNPGKDIPEGQKPPQPKPKG